MIADAFEIEVNQVRGPGWIGSENYDVIANIPAGATVHQVHLMLQKLLIERFRLAIHKEERLVSGYRLVVGNGGPHLLPLKEDDPTARIPDVRISTNGYLEVKTVSELARSLSAFLAVPVADETGITGRFSISLAMSLEGLDGLQAIRRTANPQTVISSDGPQAPSVFDAVKDLGLRLEGKKISRIFVIVDSADKVPTEN